MKSDPESSSSQSYEPCRTYRGVMVPYLDGELAAGMRRGLEEHLAGCSECRRVLDSHRRVAGLLAAGSRESERALGLRELTGTELAGRVRAAVADGVSHGLAQRVPHGDAVTQQRIQRRPAVFQAVAAAAATAVVAVGLWSFMVDDDSAGPRAPGGTHVAESNFESESVDASVEDELLAHLDLLEAFHAEGIEPSVDLVQLLLDEDEAESMEGNEEEDDVVQEVFKYMLEEELLFEQL